MREEEAREIRDREERERSERERSVREADEALKATAVELGKLTRQKILTQRDDEFVVDTATATAKMPCSEATEYNRQQIEMFLEQVNRTRMCIVPNGTSPR